MWLLSLFALDDAAEHILGDLLEEFTRLASKSGVPFARRWYWRQTFKTIFQLALLGFRTAPGLTTAAVAGGFFLRKLVARWVEPPIFAVLERYHVYEHHFGTYMFFASTGIDIGHLITFLLIGFVVALLARGREMVATMTLGLVFGAMLVVAFAFTVTHWGYGLALSRATWNFADSLAIVIAGTIIRTHRIRAATRHLPA
jgi:hypothetical protein